MRYVVNVSGGLTSCEALRRCLDAHGTENTTAVFADTLIEDEDLYRFLADQEEYFGITIHRVQDGRTPFQVMKDERYITLQSTAPCSKLLKSKAVDRWIRENIQTEYTAVFGLDWTEPHRIKRLARAIAPVKLWCPLAERPYLMKQDIIAQLEHVGIEPPRLYGLGFHHNNCGGGCVKAGQAHWAHLLKVMPERYAEWEQQEEGIRQHLHKNVSILRDRTGGKGRPMTLAQFREKQDNGYASDDLWGGCGCFLD
jgi:hypothetical protein